MADNSEYTRVNDTPTRLECFVATNPAYKLIHIVISYFMKTIGIIIDKIEKATGTKNNSTVLLGSVAN